MQLTQMMTEKKAYSVRELHSAYPVSIGFLRDVIRHGELPSYKFRRKVMVLREDWKAFLQRAATLPGRK